MAEPFMGEIKIVGFGFPPKGWAECNGQFMTINQNQALFSLLGTMYGGNGQTTFALPDLRDRVPIHFISPQHTQGTRAGEAAHTLTQSELPMHTHVLNASTQAGNAAAPTGNVLADSVGQIYAAPANLVTLQPGTLTNTGGGQAHNNMQPYLALNWCI